MKRLEGVAGLMELAKSPFMLGMILDTLPRFAFSRTLITRAELFDEFVELHFVNEQKKRLAMQRSRMKTGVLSAFSELEGDSFNLLCIRFSKRLSNAIFMEQGGHHCPFLRR